MKFRVPKLSVTLCCALVAGSAQAGSGWDWQLSGPFDLSRDVAAYDVDPDNHSAAEVAALKTRGITTICYVSVGTIEGYRNDIDQFPHEVIGRVYEDWPDERFLDIRQLDILLPLMQARFQRCADLGFDAVEPDNQDVYQNESGFDITATQTVQYLSALTDMAHKMGLTIGQKNVPDLTRDLVGQMDFVITESCFVDGWCEGVAAYAAVAKPVYAAEYTDTDVNFAAACAFGNERGFDFILKDRDLTRALSTCP